MKHKKPATVVAVLVLLYALVGFVLLPAILKPKLVDALEENTHRAVRLGSLRINPFALSITLNDFELKDRDSTCLLAFSRLYLNYESSPFSKGPIFFLNFRSTLLSSRFGC